MTSQGGPVRRAIAWALIVLAGCASNTQGATFYVDAAGGDDGNNGTSMATAWKTVAKVNSSMPGFANGDSVLFKRGETWATGTGAALRISRTGLTNYLTFGAYGTGDKPVISHDPSADGCGPVTIVANDVDYIRIDNLDARQTAGTGAAIGCARIGTDHFWVSDCNATSATSNGIVVRYCDTFLIEGCIITGCANSGIAIMGSETSKATNGTIRNNTLCGPGNDGITIHPDDDDFDVGANFLLENNVGGGFNEQAFDIGGGSNVTVRNCESYGNRDGMALGAYVDTVLVDRCHIHDNSNLGITFGRTDGLTIRYSIIANSGHHSVGIGDTSGGSASCRNTAIYNCVIAHSSDGCAIIAYPGTDGLYVKNNIVVSTGGSSAQFVGYFNVTYASTRSDFDTNIWWQEGRSPFSLGQNSRFVDPQLVDLPNGDYRLRPTSPAIDSGLDVGLTRDFEGRLVPQSLLPDTGAFESPVPQVYTLDVAAGYGSVIRDPDQATYMHGQTVTLTAVAQAGYHLANWSGDLTGGGNPATVVMDSNKAVTANFAADAYTLSVSAAGGSVSRSPDKASYGYDEVVTLQPTPDPGRTFTGWSGDLSGSANPSTVVMNGDKSVTAGFSLNTYTLNATAVHGSVAKSPDQTSYSHGTTVSLQAVAGEGYEFVDWSGALSGNTNPATLVMDDNKSVTASFAIVARDKDAPVLLEASPTAGAIQAPLNSLVSLHLVDVGEGVDANTVSIAVNGKPVYSGNLATCTSASGVCRRVGNKRDYAYAYQPTGDFDYDATITVVVNAADLEGNAMVQQSYSFRTQMRAFGANRCASWGPEGVDKGNPETLSDANGSLWVAYHAGAGGARDIYVAKRGNGSEQFGEPVRVTDHVLDQCNPDIALGTDGRLFVVWQDNRRGNWDIYASTSTDGITWSAPVRVSDSDYDAIKPAVAVDSRSPSRAYVTWQDGRAGNQDVYVSVSSDYFVSKTVQAVTANTRDQTGPQIAVDALNTICIVWTDHRNESADVYGAASDRGPWSNVALVTDAGNQFSPVIAVEPGGSVLHLAWVSDLAGDNDICYARSDGLPTGPLVGRDIIDDRSGADQETPAIVVGDGTAPARVFVCWQDARNAGHLMDMDIYAAEIKDGDETNLFLGDGGTCTTQSEPAIALDLDGRPYVVWTDSRNAEDQIYFAAGTFVEPTPMDERLIVGVLGGTVGVASPTGEDDVSVAIPAGACPHDVTVSIARIRDLQPGSPVDVLPYEFGPSGLVFDVPVTITIPYLVADYGGDPPEPYWYDPLAGMLTQQGIANIEHVVLSARVGALRFQTTHFTAYTLVAAEQDDGTSGSPSGSGGGGGCSFSPVSGGHGAVEFCLPYVLLAVVMGRIRLRDRSRDRSLSRAGQGKAGQPQRTCAD